jgi:hypothetical protein
MGWIKNLQQINSEDEELLDEFILLFSTLNEGQLSDNKYAIRWKWTTSGEYFAASMYDAQFLGAFPMFRAPSIWQDKTKPKYRFFS